MNKLNKININDLPKEIPNYKTSAVTKEKLTTKWLYDWVRSDIKAKKINGGEIIPSKQKLAKYLGISSSTVQNAIKAIEDKGLFECRQKTGTIIKISNNADNPIKKRTSKRDEAINELSQIILENKINSTLPTIADIALKLGIAVTAVRLACNNLIERGILRPLPKKKGYEIIKYPEQNEVQKAETLVTSIKESILGDINSGKFETGKRIPTRQELSLFYKVSKKTIQDALNELEKSGIIKSRRGKYGTIVIRKSTEQVFYQPECSIFAAAEETLTYRWKRIENELKKIINQDFEIGDKLPSISNISKIMNVSTNTVKKALKTLADDGYVEFKRGRTGGTFITDIPETSETYRWLAVNPNYLN